MNDWEDTTLGDLVQKGQGIIQTGPFGSQLHASDYVEAGIPCIMPVNLKNNKIDLSNVSFISHTDAGRLSKHLVKKGDIIYSRRGDITQKGLVSSEEEGCFCGTGCILVRPGKKLNSTFLHYFLSTPASKSWIINNAVGITMPNLNTKILGNFPIKCPSINLQNTLAAVLANLDSRIDVNNKINAELEALAKFIYNYWFDSS